MHAVASHARVVGRPARVIRPTGAERRVPGLVPVQEEPTRRASAWGLNLCRGQLPLRPWLLGGLGLLHAAPARPLAMQSTLEAGPTC